MSHFTDVIKKMKRKKDEDEKTTVVGRRSMFNTIGLMKKASVLLKDRLIYSDGPWNESLYWSGLQKQVMKYEPFLKLNSFISHLFLSLL